MRGVEVEVVAGAVEVGGHRGEVVRSVLAVVAPAHLDAGDLGQRIGAVGRLQRAGEEVLFVASAAGQSLG